MSSLSSLLSLVVLVVLQNAHRARVTPGKGAQHHAVPLPTGSPAVWCGVGVVLVLSVAMLLCLHYYTVHTVAPPSPKHSNYSPLSCPPIEFYLFCFFLQAWSSSGRVRHPEWLDRVFAKLWHHRCHFFLTHLLPTPAFVSVSGSRSVPQLPHPNTDRRARRDFQAAARGPWPLQCQTTV